MRALLPLLLAVGCASSSAASRTIAIKPVTNASAPPVRLSVGDRHVTGSNLDAVLTDNCVRGSWGHIPLNFCRVDKGDGPEQHWVGSSGDFTVRRESDQRYSVDGWWNLDTGRTVSMTQAINVGQGGGWDELRKEPALMAVAVTAANLEPTHLH